MSIQGEIRTLYSDREQTQAVFPRTKTSAVSDENGVGLNVRLKNAAPRNLLDNSDFSNPVNQRGATIYTEPDGTYSYTIDRWKHRLGTITVDDGFTNWKSTKDAGYKKFRQVTPHKFKIGSKYTLAMLARVNDLSGNCELRFATNSGEQISGASKYLSKSSDFIWLIVPYYATKNEHKNFIVEILVGNTANDYLDIDIKAMCLYEGEYTAETLPEYQPKGYGAELAECMRYYWPMAGLYQAYGHGNEYGSFAADIVLPVEMRVNPTVSYTLRSFIINGEDKKSTLNRVDVECSTKRLRFSPVTLIASDKNKIMRMAVSDIKLSADL